MTRVTPDQQVQVWNQIEIEANRKGMKSSYSGVASFTVSSSTADSGLWIIQSNAVMKGTHTFSPHIYLTLELSPVASLPQLHL